MRSLACFLFVLAFAACSKVDTSGLGDPTHGIGGEGNTAGAAGMFGGTTGLMSTGGTGGIGATPADAGALAELGCNKMDILFVIDNSGSMAAEQENLVQNFPRFVEVLDAFRGGDLQYRVAVTTTAVGSFDILGIQAGSSQEGALLKTASMTNPWLDRGEPNLTETFSELATVGLGGSPQEQPLKAAQYALVDRVEDGTNAGFHRSDALLALVFLTDEDDGSTLEVAEEPTQASSDPITDLISGIVPGALAEEAPVSDFVDAFDDIAQGRDRWAAAVIAGDQQPECMSEFGEAAYAGRLIEFVDMVGDNAKFGSICSGDLSLELDEALNTFSGACETFVPLI